MNVRALVLIILAAGCGAIDPPEVAEAAAGLTSQTLTDPSGHVYVSSPTSQVIYRADNALAPLSVWAGALNVAGYLDGARTSARFNGPQGMDLYNAGSGVLYVADGNNHAIRKFDFYSKLFTTMVTPATTAAAGGSYGLGAAGVAVNQGNGIVYVTDNANGVVWKYHPDTGRLNVFVGQIGQHGCRDGAASYARFNNMSQAKWSSSNGVLAVADQCSATSACTRLITPDGSVSSICSG